MDSLIERIGIELDKLNISILSTEGVDYKRYIELFNMLHIPCVVRTDNDFSKVPYKNEFSLTGLQKAITIFKLQNQPINQYFYQPLLAEKLNKKIIKYQTEFMKKTKTDKHRESIHKIFDSNLRDFGIYLSKKDLEKDLKIGAR